MLNSLLDSGFGYLVKDDTMRFSGIKLEYFLQMPSNSFPFTVFIGCEPDAVGFFGFVLEVLNQCRFGRVNDIVRGIMIIKIDT